MGSMSLNWVWLSCVTDAVLSRRLRGIAEAEIAASKVVVRKEAKSIAERCKR